MKKEYILTILFAACCLFNSCAEKGENSTVTVQTLAIPSLENKGTGKQLILDGEPFIMLAGELHNSSSSNLAYMDSVFPLIKQRNVNTILAPVYWEILEPEENKFDFTLVDGMIDIAKKNQLKLVILWFGSWKNACSSYVPEWVKRDVERFPRAKNSKGERINLLSSLSEVNWKADAKAFSSLMAHIRDIDISKTVLAVQVENEPGIRFDNRDYSDLANQVFNQKVPEPLMTYLKKNREILVPEFLDILKKNGLKDKGTWCDILGNDAPEMFMAWNIASYINHVAREGKRSYPLPMYANAWLYGNINDEPGTYPSGGPVAKTFPIWLAAAPEIDILAPDIYRKDLEVVCDEYTRMGNTLFIPETYLRLWSTPEADVYYALAEKGGICFAPFGIDNPQYGVFNAEHPLWESYKILDILTPYVAEKQGTSDLHGFRGRLNEVREYYFDDYKVEITFKDEETNGISGFGLIIKINANEFLIAGRGFNAKFISTVENMNSYILEAYELIPFADKSLKEGRRLNGDETGNGSDHNVMLMFDEGIQTIKKAKVYSSAKY